MMDCTQTMIAATFYRKSRDELPAGRYYIGDLDAFLMEEIYETILGKIHLAPGTYTTDSEHALYASPCPRGIFAGSEKATYSINSGTIGIVPVKFGNFTKYPEAGTIYDFRHPFLVSYQNGVLSIRDGHTKFEIDTTIDLYAGSDSGYDSWS